MEKDFKKWHDKKIILNLIRERVFFHEREVWWCSSGLNVGFEQDGKGEKFARPILIFKKFNNEVFWGIPLSTKVKNGKFYASVNLGDKTLRVVIISQLRLMDAKRLIDKIGVINKNNYGEIQKAVINLCGS